MQSKTLLADKLLEWQPKEEALSNSDASNRGCLLQLSREFASHLRMGGSYTGSEGEQENQWIKARQELQGHESEERRHFGDRRINSSFCCLMWAGASGTYVQWWSLGETKWSRASRKQTRVGTSHTWGWPEELSRGIGTSRTIRDMSGK